MDTPLKNISVAVLVTHGFEEIELTSPCNALREASAEVHLVSPLESHVRAWKRTDWDGEYQVDVPLSRANPDDYDALLLPGGVMNPDSLRIDADALAFVRHVFEAGKPIAAICHAPWILIDAGVVQGCRITSYPSLQSDLRNAGAIWVDQEVVVDNGLVSSRNPDDLEAFNATMIEAFGERRRIRRGAA